VLIRVKMAGVNPVDHITVSGAREIKPLPHIPGADTSGVGEVGEHVMSLKSLKRFRCTSTLFSSYFASA